jgi:hypothetical protein
VLFKISSITRRSSAFSSASIASGVMRCFSSRVRTHYRR